MNDNGQHARVRSASRAPHSPHASPLGSEAQESSHASETPATSVASEKNTPSRGVAFPATPGGFRDTVSHHADQIRHERQQRRISGDHEKLRDDLADAKKDSTDKDEARSEKTASTAAPPPSRRKARPPNVRVDNSELPPNDKDSPLGRNGSRRRRLFALSSPRRRAESSSEFQVMVDSIAGRAVIHDGYPQHVRHHRRFNERANAPPSDDSVSFVAHLPQSSHKVHTPKPKRATPQKDGHLRPAPIPLARRSDSDLVSSYQSGNKGSAIAPPTSQDAPKNASAAPTPTRGSSQQPSPRPSSPSTPTPAVSSGSNTHNAPGSVTTTASNSTPPDEESPTQHPAAPEPSASTASLSQNNQGRNDEPWLAAATTSAGSDSDSTRSSHTATKAGPLVGRLINKDDASYVFMYNMLTGIRVSVSRCEAKPRRPITSADYTTSHKYVFDVSGNELETSSRYDFKFKDYAPWVSRELRAAFCIDPHDYLGSLTNQYILSELGSPGKSGSFFYFSRDYRFIIKTIKKSEHRYLRKILPRYHGHVRANPHTLICRFYGIYRIKTMHGKKIYFIIMNNLFPAHLVIDETYDLKGSTQGRCVPQSVVDANPHAVLKDLNWIHKERVLSLGVEKKALFEEQLHRDTQLLISLGCMDYSLLTGIHFIRPEDAPSTPMRPAFSNPSITPPRMVESPSQASAPSLPANDQQSSTTPRVQRSGSAKEPAAAHAVLVSAFPEAEHPIAAPIDTDLIDREHSDLRFFYFYQNLGGIRGASLQEEPLDVIYYISIIDFLSPYHTRKKLEHFFKGIRYDRRTISAVNPVQYGERFFKFIYKYIAGNDGP